MTGIPLLDSEAGRQMLNELAAERALDDDCLLQLLKAAEAHQGMVRRRGLYQVFDTILDRAGR